MTGLIGGLLHPLAVPAHVLALLAIGLLIGQQRGRLVPLAAFFAGLVAGLAALAFAVATTSAANVLLAAAAVTGLLVALARPLPVLVGAFAIFHGHAHGAELPPGADVVAYSVGFVVATGMLHLVGIAFGLLARWPAGRFAVRAAGGVIALAGVAFLRGIG